LGVEEKRSAGNVDLMNFLRAEKDRVAGWAVILAGGVALILGYFGVANSPYVADQLSFVISGGLGGLFLLGLGATLLLSADLRDEWGKLDRIERALLEGSAPDAAGAGEIEWEAPIEVASTHQPEREPAAAPEGPPSESPYRRRRPSPRESVGSVSARLALGISSPAAAVLAIAWLRAANTSDTQTAIDSTALGCAAVLLVGLAAACSTLFIRRAVTLRASRLLDRWDKTPRLRPRLFPSAEMLAAPSNPPLPLPLPLPLASRDVIHLTGSGRFHERGCIALQLHPESRVVSVGAATDEGLVPCGLCAP
jgi:hypothetical protein